MITTTIVGYGQSTPKLINTYIDLLDKYLPSYYPRISWKLYRTEVKHANAIHLSEKIEEKVLGYKPNIVFIQLTAADSDTLDENFVTLNEYRAHLSAMVQEITAHNNRSGLNNCQPIPVFIAPPPVKECGSLMGRTNNRLKQYNYIAKDVAKQENGVYIDLYQLLIEEEDYLLEDGVTLNQKGQELLYDIVFREFTKLINYEGVLKDRQ